MPRPSTADARRDELLPLLARAFARVGYRRATTAELARRCAVPENTLFRLWRGKKRMYLAALDHLYDRTVAVWRAQLAGERPGTAAEQLLDYEGEHYGEHGLYRIVFTGLSETDDAASHSDGGDKQCASCSAAPARFTSCDKFFSSRVS